LALSRYADREGSYAGQPKQELEALSVREVIKMSANRNHAQIGMQLNRTASERFIGTIDSSYVKESFRASPDSKRMAYVSELGECPNYKYLVIVDDKKGTTYVDKECRPIFSPDGKHVAYSAKARTLFGRKYRVIVDMKGEKKYNKIHHITFSPDGRRLAYVADDGKHQFMVIDGREEKAYHALWGPVFSPNSKKVAYAARLERKLITVMDGEEIDKCDRSFLTWDYYPMTFSPNSERFTYIAYKNPSFTVMTDGHPGKQYNYIAIPPFFSPDSNRLAYAAADAYSSKEVWAVVDGRENNKFNHIYSIVFSNNSEHVAFSANTGAKALVVVDGQQGKSYKNAGSLRDIWYLTFSPDSQHLAYTAILDNSHEVIVVDGQEGKEYRAIADVCFSPDSKRVAYVADGQFVVVDGVEGIKHKNILLDSLTFSPGSLRIAYGEVEYEDQMCVVVNKHKGKKYDNVVLALGGGRITFDGPDELHYLAQKGGNVYSVHETLK
jgi:Tol biopolymer transport system component